MFNKNKIRELKDRMSRLEKALLQGSEVIPPGSIVEWEGRKTLVCVKKLDERIVGYAGDVGNYYTIQVIKEDFTKGAIINGVMGRYLGEPIGSEKLWADKETKLKIKEFYKENK